MKNECVDPEIGNLRHSYELDLLTEEEVDLFQEHLLTCDYCFSDLKQFEMQARLLRTDETICNEVAALVNSPANESFGTRVREWLWPKVPFILRPGVALFMLILLVYPAWLGTVNFFNAGEIASLHEISLLPTRSSNTESFIVPMGQDIVLEFVCYGSIVDVPYKIDIYDAENNLLQSINDFRGFDQYETGRLLLSGKLVQPGKYLLTVSDMSTDPPTVRQKYIYQITR